MTDELTKMRQPQLLGIARAIGLEPPDSAPAKMLRQAIREKRASEAEIAALDGEVRCGYRARKGTGEGVCDRPLDGHGRCDRAGDHIQ